MADLTSSKENIINVPLTIAITGANTGIGLECAKKLCELGHNVIITVRDKEKGETTLTVIKTLVPNAKVDFFILDLSDFSSIRRFVDDFHASGNNLDILINNAGVFPPFKGQERWNVEGNPKMELAMTVNCLGTFLLTNLLLNDLKASVVVRGDGSPSRIVNVSSGLTVIEAPLNMVKYPLSLDDFMLEVPGSYHSGYQAYRNSKVALNLWSNELAKKLKDLPVLVNTVDPGWIPSSNLSRHNKGIMSKLIQYVADTFIGRRLFHTASMDVGRDRILHVALDNLEVSGKFFSQDEVHAECPEVQDVDNQKRIWEICSTYTKL